MSNQLRILWISDIHWKTEYENNEKIKGYINNFISLVSQKETKYDYVIITGDIAYSGKKEEYESFHRIVLSKLQNGYTKFIFCPGNHDLNTDVLLKEYSEKLFQTLKQENDNIEKRRKVLGSTMEKEYCELFSEYKKFCEKSEPMYSNPLLNCTNSDHFKNLFGLYEDKENGVFFLSINSSWFSYPTYVYNSILAENYFTNLNGEDKSAYNNILNMLELKENKFTQYGHMYFGNELLEDVFKELEELKKNYLSPITIILVHHPSNWASWNDRVSEKNDKTAILDKFVEYGDILLAGHEHSPVKPPNLVQDSLIQLDSPKLLDDKIADNSSGEGIILHQYGFTDLTLSLNRIKEISRIPFKVKSKGANEFEFEKNDQKDYKIKSLLDNRHENIHLERIVDISLTQEDKYNQFDFERFFSSRGIDILYDKTIKISGYKIDIFIENPQKIRCVLHDIIDFDAKNSGKSELIGQVLSFYIVISKLYNEIKKIYKDILASKNYILYIQYMDLWEQNIEKLSLDSDNNKDKKITYEGIDEQARTNRRKKEIIFECIRSRFLEVLQDLHDVEYDIDKLEIEYENYKSEMRDLVKHQDVLEILSELRYTFDHIDVISWSVYRKKITA